MLKLRIALNDCELLLGLTSMIYYGICRHIAGIHIPLLGIWLLMGVVLLIKSCFCIFTKFEHKKYITPMIRIFDGLFTAFFVTVSLFFIGILWNMKNPSPGNCDYIFVLGAAVNGDVPSNVLQKRIDKAYEYLSCHPDTKVVCTGGRGAGDYLSEGQCSAMVLATMGIDTDRILFEEQSATTAENVQFGLKKITEQPACIGIVSSNFHIFRAKLTMKSFTDAEVKGIGASFFSILLPHYMLREYLTFLVDLCLGNIKLSSFI